MRYIVETRSWCGMTLNHGEYETLAEAKVRVEARIAYLQSMCAEVEQHDLLNFEVNTPDAAMIPDWDGMLVIREEAEPEDESQDPDWYQSDDADPDWNASDGHGE